MIVAAGQFAVTPDWKTNALTCVELMAKAAQQQASLLVLQRRYWPGMMQTPIFR